MTRVLVTGGSGKRRSFRRSRCESRCERETLLSIDKARRVLGHQPQHSWRDHVSVRP